MAIRPRVQGIARAGFLVLTGVAVLLVVLPGMQCPPGPDPPVVTQCTISGTYCCDTFPPDSTQLAERSPRLKWDGFALSWRLAEPLPGADAAVLRGLIRRAFEF